MKLATTSQSHHTAGITLLSLVTLIFLSGAYLSDARAIELISTGLDGQANENSYYAKTSADGHYVAFYSYASNLVVGDTNGVRDVFLNDTQTGTNTRLSTDSTGVEGNATSFNPSISADGRYVVFDSHASNLVAGDTNGVSDIFLKDTQTGTTTRLSTDSTGVEGNGYSKGRSLAISADGRYVVFHSSASNLVVGDTNGVADIFIKDTQTGSTTRLSTDSAGVEVNADSFDSTINADGRYVVFSSRASNLVVGDTNGVSDVFLKDTQTGNTTRLSTDSAGVEGNDYSSSSAISADGRYVVFHSDASNLVAGDTNGVRDVFVKDTQTGTTTRLSTDSAGVEGNDYSDSPAISADGRYVMFDSEASNLVAGDTNGKWDIFRTENPLWVYTDSDNDGLPDYWEMIYGLDPNDPSDADSDLDWDGLTALEEYAAGTQPVNPDSDADGRIDGLDSDPLVAAPNLCGGDNVVLINDVYLNGTIFDCRAQLSIKTDGTVTVESGADVLYMAPVLKFSTGFSVEADGIFHAVGAANVAP